MSKADAWMPLYVGDYMLDTQHLTMEQSGAYLHLLMSQWRVGYVPTDPMKLAQLCRVTRTHWVRHLAPAILPFFEVRDDQMVQRRLEIERRKVEKTSEKPAKNEPKTDEKPAKNGAKLPENDPHKVNDNNDGTPPLAQARARVPSQSQSQSEEVTPSSLRDDGPPHELALFVPVPPKIDTARGARLPADWYPDPALCAFASELDVDADYEAGKFRDFWHSKAGAAARKVDWSMTWKNWCRSAAERAGKRPGAATGKPSNRAWMTDLVSDPPTETFIEGQFEELHR